MAKQMDENDNTGRISMIVRIQNNTDRTWTETAWSDIFENNDSFNIDRRLPEFEDGFTLYPGSEDQILVKASGGAFGISNGCAGNHTFADENGNTFTFKWKWPASGDGKMEWKSDDNSLRNAVYSLDREDDWRVIYFVIKTDGEPIKELTVADSTLSTFQDVMGFIPIVGDLANTGIYASRGMAKEAILSALGGATGAAGKGLSVAAKSAKYASKAGKISKIQKGVDAANDAGQLGVKAAYGDDITKDIVGKAAAKGVGKASKKNLKSQQAKPQSKYEFDMNSSGAPIKESPHKMNNMKLKGAEVFDDYKDEITGFGVDVAFGDNALDAAKSAGLKRVGKKSKVGAYVIDKATERQMKELNDFLVSGSKTMDKTKDIVFKTQFGYIAFNKSGWCTVTQNKDEAARFNEILYQDKYNQKYYEVASGSWKGYYLASHWDNGVGAFSGWGDCTYWAYERFRLRCKSAKSESFSVKLREETNTLYCYYRSSKYQECLVIKE